MPSLSAQAANRYAPLSRMPTIDTSDLPSSPERTERGIVLSRQDDSFRLMWLVTSQVIFTVTAIFAWWFIYTTFIMAPSQGEEIVIEVDMNLLQPPPPPEDFSLFCGLRPPLNFSADLMEAAERWNINPRVLALTVYRESKCDAKALGFSGEIGLGQIYPAVWTSTLAERGIINTKDDLWDSKTNLNATAFVLSESYRYASGNSLETLRRYNGSGPRAQKYAVDQVRMYQSLWIEAVWIQDTAE